MEVAIELAVLLLIASNLVDLMYEP